MTMRHVCSWQHQSTSEKIMGIKETPHGVYFLCGKSKPLGKKMPLPQLLTVCCPNWTSRTQKKVTAKHCQDKEGQPFRIFCFAAKSVRYARTLGQLFLSSRTFFLEITYWYFLLTQLILFPSQVSAVVEDWL